MKTVQQRIEDLNNKKIRLIERINQLLMIKDTPTGQLDLLTRELRDTNLRLVQTRAETLIE